MREQKRRKSPLLILLKYCSTGYLNFTSFVLVTSQNAISLNMSRKATNTHYLSLSLSLSLCISLSLSVFLSISLSLSLSHTHTLHFFIFAFLFQCFIEHLILSYHVQNANFFCFYFLSFF